MRRTIAAAGLGLALVLTGCGGTVEEVEFESSSDCDYEDALNRERPECSDKQIKAAQARKKAEEARKRSGSTTKPGAKTGGKKSGGKTSGGKSGGSTRRK